MHSFNVSCYMSYFSGVNVVLSTLIIYGRCSESVASIVYNSYLFFPCSHSVYSEVMISVMSVCAIKYHQ